MNRSALLVAGSLLASGAHADILLNKYATDAADSATANALYGIQSYGNPSSTTNVSVKDGAIILDVPKIASDDAEGFTANFGLLHPIDVDWNEYDLTSLTGISFEFRNSAKITDGLAVSFGSAAYTDDVAKAGTVYEVVIKGTANMAAGTSFKPATVSIIDFAPPSWWEPPTDFPTIPEVLSKVKNLQFAPKTSYTEDGMQNGEKCKMCITPSTTSQTFEIRNIMLEGCGNGFPPPNPITKTSPRRASAQALSASWANGVLSLGGIEGVGPVEVRSLDGRVVASFAPAANVPLRLSRGTWILSAKRDGTTLVRTFTTLGR